MSSFIECTSINISFDIMGIATISYTVVTDSMSFSGIESSLTLCGQTFNGYVASASINPIPRTKWYEIHVTLIATTN